MKLIDSSKRKGRVYLVGAGPGDPELLTVKAFRLMQEVDCILVDNLVSEDIVRLIPAGVDIYMTGKKCGGAGVSQSEINNLIVELAGAGKDVMRLKGGDPLIFSRAGEELQAVRAAGISCEVVSGITAGLASAAQLGIPLTDRDIASGIILITGHRSGEDAYPWKALVDSGLTLVIYMPLRNLADLVDNLLDAGLSPSTRAAAVQDATNCGQSHVIADLSQLPSVVAGRGMKSPLLIIVGEVIAEFEDICDVVKRVQLEVIR